MKKHTAFALISIFALTGCFRSAPTISYFALTGDRCAAPGVTTFSSPIRIEKFIAPASIDSRLLFSKGTNQYGEYQSVRWKEPPSIAIAESLREAIRCATAVSTGNELITGDIKDLQISDKNIARLEVIITRKSTKSEETRFVYESEALDDISLDEVNRALNNLVRQLQQDVVRMVKK